MGYFNSIIAQNTPYGKLKLTIFVNKEGKTGFSPRVKISALRLSRYFGGVCAIVADTNKLCPIIRRHNEQIRDRSKN